MHNGDVLGDEGRKALNACVKVKIYGKLETRRYNWETAVKRLWGCYVGQCRLFGASFYMDSGCGWQHVQQLLLPTECDRQGYPLKDNTYSIVDIHDALVRFDKRTCVEKYPKEGPGSDKLRDLIDERRADVEREYTLVFTKLEWFVCSFLVLPHCNILV